MTYEFDVFISYRRKEPVLSWVRELFAPLVEQWLHESLPHEARVFRDEESIETGAAWPLALEQGLLRSRLLVPVFSPSYFRSQWCLAEFESMRARERVVGLRTPAQPNGLICPVVFHDGEHFPEAARALQSKDLRQWNQSGNALRGTERYVGFVHEIQGLAGELATLLARAPDWRPDWPIERPPSAPAVHAPLPRLA